MARPKLIPSRSQLTTIYEMAKRGSRERGIYLALKMGQDTWTRWKQDYPDVRNALERGHEEFHDQLLDDVKRITKESNSIAGPIFLLKARHGYRELDDQPALAPQVIIQLPGAAQPSRVGAVIDAPQDSDPAPLLPAPDAAKVDRG